MFNNRYNAGANKSEFVVHTSKLKYSLTQLLHVKHSANLVVTPLRLCMCKVFLAAECCSSMQRLMRNTIK